MLHSENKAVRRLSVSKTHRRLALLGALLVVFLAAKESHAWYPKCTFRDEYPGACCWSGIAPVCTAGCPNGYGEVDRSKDAYGALSYCTIGTHKLCCPADIG
jgi:hypothetical protein